MDKKSKISFFILCTAVFVVTAVSFYKFYFLRDYYIKSQVDCDPAKEKCFMSECDPADDSQCPADPEQRINYYKFIEKKAYALPNCDTNNPNCPPLTCRADEDCWEILCDEAAEVEGEQCSNPADYLPGSNPLDNKN